MARKSAASLAVVTPGQRRPEPPAALQPAEADKWREIVSTKPGDWFTKDTHPLLMAYVRAMMASEVIAQQVAAFDPEWMADRDGLARFDRLMAMQERQGKLMAMLATKMRLSQQSKYGARGAETAARNAAGGTRPWERVANGE